MHNTDLFSTGAFDEKPTVADQAQPSKTRHSEASHKQIQGLFGTIGKISLGKHQSSIVSSPNNLDREDSAVEEQK